LLTVFGSPLTSNLPKKNYGSHPKWGLFRSEALDPKTILTNRCGSLLVNN
jgi:hypothetical protein